LTALIFGAGFLGSRLAAALPDARLVQADIADLPAVRAALEAHPGGSVVNAAGKSGSPNVDWCETHREETVRSNVLGPLVLAEACARAGRHLVHLASGCIFNGPSPRPGGWREDDFAVPGSTYARTKYAADLALERLANVCIVRVRMPIDAAPHPRNLITKLAHYPYVIDVRNSVTVVDDLVSVIAALIERRASGVFHAVNPGVLAHRRLLELYRERVDPSHQTTLIAEGELVARGLALQARSNCVLASPRLEAAKIAMRPVEEALDDVMRRYSAARQTRPGDPR
jgi:dTDP-4-dehydrorhamnose reductase